jgi:hypothetical protein
MTQKIRCSLLLLACGWLLAGAARAQAPAWQSVSTTLVDIGPCCASIEQLATATDASGNVYLAGYFRGTIQLSSIVLASSAPDYAGFVAKWSPASQQFLWAKKLQVAGTAGVSAINSAAVTAIATNGNAVYLAGEFYGPQLTADGKTLTNSSADGYGKDLFLLKLTDAGTSANVAWMQGAIGRSDDIVNDLVAVGNNMYLAGNTQSSNFQLGTLTATTVFGSNLFVAKVLDAGATASPVWLQTAPGAGGATPRTKLAVSGTTVYVGGHFEAPATFGTTVLTPVTAGKASLYVAKLVDSGPAAGFAWVQQLSGSQDMYLDGLAVMGGAVYFAGSYEGMVPYNGFSLYPAGGLRDMLVAKLLDAGSTSSIGWMQALGSGSNDQATALLARGNSLYLAGNFRGPTLNCGYKSVTPPSGGGQNIFLTRLLDTGSGFSCAWLQGASGYALAYAHLLASSGPTLYLAGAGTVFPSLAPTNYGLYIATLTDAVGLPTRATAALAEVAVLPSPAHGTMTVRLPAGTGAATLTLLDALGRAVGATFTAAGTDRALDLSGLAPGVYALRVQAGAAVATRKVVVE